MESFGRLKLTANKATGPTFRPAFKPDREREPTEPNHSQKEGRLLRENEDCYLARAQVDELVRTSRSRFIGSLTIAFLVAGTLGAGHFVQLQTAACWIACMLAGILSQTLYLALIKRRRRQVSDRSLRMGFVPLIFLQATIWGWAAVYLAVGQTFAVWALPGISMLGLVPSASATLGVFLPVYLAYVAGTMTPLLAADFMLSTPVGYAWFILLSVFTGMVVYLGFDFNRNFRRRILADYQLAQAAASEARLREFAEKAHTDKSRQLFEISHDLRQPIHALGLLVRALEAECAGTKAEPFAKAVVTSASSLQAFAIGLLDFSNLESAKVKAQASVFELADVIERIFNDEAADAARNSVKLNFRRSGAAVNSLVKCDAILLERILRNLISNAVKYTRGGRVRVRATADEQGSMKIDVIDNGIGIAIEDQARIFQDFERLDRSAHTKGLGLGLAIVKRTAALMGVKVEVRSRPRRGSRFRIVVPRAQPILSSQPIQPTEDFEMRKLSLLVIDDSYDVLAAIRTVLAIEVCEVLTAQSAEEGLGKARQSRRPLNLVICDFQLGQGPDGLNAIRRLRTLAGESLPAILISGEDEADLTRRAHQANVVFLRKPFSVSRLRSMIRQAVTSKREIE